MARPSKLQENPKTIVLQTLKLSPSPLSAYELLDLLKSAGIKAAPIIYRALHALESDGKVHKIHSTSAYVACNCSHTHSHELSVITVCTRCKYVQELHQSLVIEHLQKLRDLGVALAPSAVVELPIICDRCTTQTKTD
jgi:Fur family transcriptional regulator, zinc uptake regulator